MPQSNESTAASTAVPNVEHICIMLVHGVGDQKRFEYLEVIANNLYRALKKDPKRQAYLQVRWGDQTARGAVGVNWSEVPALLGWRKDNGGRIEAALREIHWSDLDEPYTFWSWLKLAGWSLSMPGLCLYSRRATQTELPSLQEPGSGPAKLHFKVRAQLFVTAMLFFCMLISLDLLYWLVQRLSFKPKILRNARGLIYDYLGDVKLYQDWCLRKKDTDSIEVAGGKSRAAIRRRMVRALIRTAQEGECGQCDGYYIMAHSLGTVVAYNALMTPGQELAHCLTEEEWNNLPAVFKKKMAPYPDNFEMPARPPWLAPEDGIDRERLFRNMRGLVTMGSPLNKFAALWPAIVPVNTESIGRTVPQAKIPWINLSDKQDIVAGQKLCFVCGPDAVGTLTDFELTDIAWADQKTMFSAHTRYWKVQEGKQRFIDLLIPWLEGRGITKPVNNLNPKLALAIYWCGILALGLFGALVLSYLIWLTPQTGKLVRASLDPHLGMNSILAILKPIYLDSILDRFVKILIVGFATVSVFSLVRCIGERWRFRRLWAGRD